MTTQQQTTTQQSELEEIFMSPSSTLIADRFSTQQASSAADCSGKCTGFCHGRVA